MAESGPSRVLNLSNFGESDNQQQYVEVGSNIYLGTKDGMKYTLVRAADSKIHLIEALSDSNTSLNSPKESFVTPVKRENNADGWSAPKEGSKLIKLIALKPEQPVCKGQGDEIGNSVLSPTLSFSSFNESENAVEKVTFEESPTDQDGSSELSYTTLLPKQKEKEAWSYTYYTSPSSNNYSAACPPPNIMRPQRYAKRGRKPLKAVNTFSPVPTVRHSTPRMRRPRQSSYQYTPQILHSTPNVFPSPDFSCNSLSESSSGHENSSSLNRSQSSIEYPRVPNNTPTSAEESSSAAKQKMFSIQLVSRVPTGVENYISLDPRETHNEKERKRRLRIKNACQWMRSLLPCLMNRTDNTSVFEQAVSYISFMRKTVGNEYDIEFLEKYYIF